MTLREAVEAGERRVPVYVGEAMYDYIRFAGYDFGANGRRVPIVCLRDRNGMSELWIRPKRVSLEAKSDSE